MKSLRLKGSSVLRIENGAGMVVEVSHGEVWLTQECNPRDYYLRSGDWLRIEDSGSVVVSAVGEDAWIGLTALRPLDWAGRVVLSRAGSNGPIRLYPAQRPELVARLLDRLGLTRAPHSA
jgi:hypothetical protein